MTRYGLPHLCTQHDPKCPMCNEPAANKVAPVSKPLPPEELLRETEKVVVTTFEGIPANKLQVVRRKR